jgi:hypothetical protein
MTEFNRRDFLKLGGAAAALAACRLRHHRRRQGARGGRRRRLRRRHRGQVHPHVGPVHRGGAGRARAAFVSCPMSNLVIGGSKTMKDITLRVQRPQALRRAGGARRGNFEVNPGKDGTPGARRRPQVRPPHRLARHRLHVRRHPGLRRGHDRQPRAARLETGPQTVALQKQLAEMRRRRRLRAFRAAHGPTAARRGPTSARARWPRTSRSTSRAPKSSARRQPRYRLQGAALPRGLGGPLSRHDRVSRQLEGDRRRREKPSSQARIRGREGQTC